MLRSGGEVTFIAPETIRDLSGFFIRSDVKLTSSFLFPFSPVANFHS